VTVRRQDLFGYALILPAMLCVLLFIVYPVGDVVRLSFTNTNLLTHREDFVGLQSYERVLSDPLMGQVMQNTAEWVLGSTSMSLILGLAIGYFLSFSFPINRLLRASILIPWVLPAVVSIAAWKWMLHPELGVINDLLKKVGVIHSAIPWLGEPGYVMFALITIAVWRHLPFVSLVVSAAVQGIPESLLEAATIDGANGWQKFRHIVLPGLAYTLTVIGVLTLIYSMNDLVTVWGATKGGPDNASEILSSFIYQVGFLSFRFGLSSALSVINFVFLLSASVTYLFVLRRTWRTADQ
jgi:multiple sugar transport system permease protein